MKKHLQLIEEAVDTGIYRTPAKVLFRRRTGKVARAYNQQQAGLYDLSRLLATAKRYARSILINPEVRDGRVHNWQQRQDLAMQLEGHIDLVCQAFDQGHWKKAIVYALWVGRYWEGLRVRTVEHIAKTERDQIVNRRKGGEAKKTPAETVAAWRAMYNRLREEFPKISVRNAAGKISNKLGGNPETIRKLIRL